MQWPPSAHGGGGGDCGRGEGACVQRCVRPTPVRRRLPRSKIDFVFNFKATIGVGRFRRTFTHAHRRTLTRGLRLRFVNVVSVCFGRTDVAAKVRSSWSGTSQLISSFVFCSLSTLASSLCFFLIPFFLAPPSCVSSLISVNINCRGTYFYESFVPISVLN